MNKNTNVWAAIVGGPSESEAIQRIAFTFGYKWDNGLDCPYAVKYPALLFDADTKTISYSDDRNGLDDKVCQVCVSLVQAMNLFLTPPNNPKKKEKTVKTMRIFEDGSALVGNSPVLYDFSPADFEEAIKIRNKLMGKEEPKKNLPVIQFRYHSPTSGSKVRTIALLNEDKVYLSGLDIEDGKKFKQFRKDRLMVGGAIWFLGLTEE